jgi:hypothetical protein
MKAIDVIGPAIEYLKEHMLSLLKNKQTGIHNKDIHWVLIVPAIWTDSAKQLMGEAAYKVRPPLYIYLYLNRNST